MERGGGSRDFGSGTCVPLCTQGHAKTCKLSMSALAYRVSSMYIGDVRVGGVTRDGMRCRAVISYRMYMQYGQACRKYMTVNTEYELLRWLKTRSRVERMRQAEGGVENLRVSNKNFVELGWNKFICTGIIVQQHSRIWHEWIY